MNVNLVTKCFIINKSSDILVLKRSVSAKIRPGGWDLPGGMVDESEDPNNAIAREIQEETGVGSISPVILFITTELSPAYILTFFYKVDWNEMPILLSDEHIEYRWVDITDFMSLELPNKFKQSALCIINMAEASGHDSHPLRST